MSEKDADKLFSGVVTQVRFRSPESLFSVVMFRPDAWDGPALERGEIKLAGRFHMNPVRDLRIAVAGSVGVDNRGDRCIEATQITVGTPKTTEQGFAFVTCCLADEGDAHRVIEGKRKSAKDIIAMEMIWDPLVKRDSRGLRRFVYFSESDKALLSKMVDRAEDMWTTDYLVKMGLDERKAIEIKKRHGKAAVKLLADNPYAMCGGMQRAGFLDADRLSHALGHPKDSVVRMFMGALHLVEEHTARGQHTAARYTDVVRAASEFLGVDYGTAKEGIDFGIELGALIERRIGGTDLLMDPRSNAAEERIAGRIAARLGKERPKRFAEYESAAVASEIDEDIGKFEEAEGFSLAPRQREAIKNSVVSSVSIVTGGPGVGKTTVLKGVINTIKKREGDGGVVLLAPTGKAAARMGESTGIPASTIHRILGWKGSGFDVEPDSPICHASTLVIDETSMVDIHLMRGIVANLSPEARLVLVGDPDQLPSVGQGNMLLDLVKSGSVPRVHLDKIHRQGEGSPIIEAAHAVNAGKVPQIANSSAYSQVWCSGGEGGDLAEANMIRDKILHEIIPMQMGEGLEVGNGIQVLTPSNNGPLGMLEMNKALQRIAQSGELDGKKKVKGFRGLMIVEGDRVIQTRNDYDLDVRNGEFGRVLEIGEDGRLVIQFEGDDREPVQIEKGKARYISLGYAITVHKSQGSEFKSVIMPVTNTYGHGLIADRALDYTAITRAKERVVLVGDGKAFEKRIKSVKSLARVTTLESRMRERFGKDLDAVEVPEAPIDVSIAVRQANDQGTRIQGVESARKKRLAAARSLL
ncbi:MULTISPECIES: AAA family ATPase [unclassified Thioalkalivibrio]|uniref:AAA family ATPase n=1 Tax=unclassified Thioalkalivibrio TaxID=2621013 RepID=UPI0003A0E03C|nr:MULTISPECIES: AAA family ATPase [unclassified Thioalkalivibrio]